MRRKRVLIVLGLAILSGIGAGYGMLRFLQERPVALGAEAPERTTEVVVAARDLEVGRVLQSEDVKTVQWPEGELPSGYFQTSSEVVGRGVMTPVSMNEPLMTSKIADKAAGGGLPITIPEGMRAVSVRVDEVIGVAGFVLPNTRVDVLLTISPPNDRDDPRTRIILENVRTLAAGQTVQQDADGEPMTVTVITLLVDPADAEKLVLASTQGRIQLALRNTMDVEDAETSGTRVSSLLVRPDPSPSSGPPQRRARPTPAPAPQEQRSNIVEIYKGGVRTLMNYDEVNDR